MCAVIVRRAASAMDTSTLNRDGQLRVGHDHPSGRPERQAGDLQATS